MGQNITLNLPYDLSDSEWTLVTTVYQSMDGWLENKDMPYWYGTETDNEYICASVEPSGLVITAQVNEMIWLGWITKLCAKLSHALHREIYDAEM